MNLTLKELIDSHRTITILSHINPDADAIGSSLGLYALLRGYGKQVEVVNHSVDIPMHLDFLPNFSKIKRQISYDKSLIIACDCGSMDRLGFDLLGRVIINIDHHHTNQNYGTLNLVDCDMSATSQVVYSLTKEQFHISSDIATCFYTALVSDTNYFTIESVDESTFAFAHELISLGANQKRVGFNLTQRRSLASLRILGRALGSLELHRDATVASIIIDQDMISAAGARMSDLDGIVEYARSLVTVEVGILLVRYDKDIRVSLRSKKEDISIVARYFGGGGHRYASGFTQKFGSVEEILDRILKRIDTLGWREF
ncbi:MAG: bifunctional oligoribonuclease/PAP phosphatase NrnA [Campylobacterota bacterium]|nr:bifunctional oligoribonuclease/PAP phosphatase NrnA [Campylobacterota bacterium]